MSAIFGVFKKLGEGISDKTIDIFKNLLSHRGPDGVKFWKSDNIVLGHCMLQTTPESLHESLPFTDFTNQLSITSDSRLDNREEIANLLNISQHVLGTLSDSELILSAYRRFGSESVAKLVGDFSFAIFDHLNKKLFCARDVVGIKPFYYYNSTHSFIFCSEIKPIICLLDSVPKINYGMVGEYLSNQFSNRHETLFDCIYRLLPAHYCTVGINNFVAHRYWNIDFQNILNYKDHNQYYEHFTEIFTQSVNCRLRSKLPVSIELSGGIDSSAITSAAFTLRSSQISKQDLIPISVIFPQLSCDEQKFTTVIEKELDFDLIRVKHTSNYSLTDWRNQVLKTYHFPFMPNLTICDNLVKTIRNRGSKVILSGIGGDEWFTGYFNLFHLAKHLKISDIFQESRLQLSINHKRYIKLLLSGLLWPCIPSFIKSPLLKHYASSAIPDWLSKEFILKTDLIDRIIFSETRLNSKVSNNSPYYQFIASDNQGFFLETLDCHRASFGVENRYPFLDKRVIEFAASLPEYMKTYRGYSKHIIRQSFKNLLPQTILTRTDKAEFSYFFGQTFSFLDAQNYFEHLELYDIGCINKDIFLKKISETIDFFRKSPERPCNNIWPIWLTFATDLWLTSIFKSPSCKNIC